MNKIKKYIPIMVEVLVFSLCFTLLVYESNKKKIELITPKYVTLNTLLTASSIGENMQNINDIITNVNEEEKNTQNVEIIEEKKESPNDEIKKDNYYNNYDLSNSPILKTYTSTISYYGPDCGGCYSGYTASGYYIGKKGEPNNIYYNDKTYGTLKIVAADKSIPFGTVLNIKINDKNNLAIVLDRGDIGFDKKFQFDMLVENEALSYQLGVNYNTTVQVLRYGY